MVVEGRTVACRIRFFKDDLEKALRAASGRPGLRISGSDRADSVAAGYIARTLMLRADGGPITLHLTGSGTEQDEAAQEIVWYALEGEMKAPVQRLSVLDGLLFESFHDQQNILLLLRLPEDDRQTLYFVASDPREQSVGW
jgi:hypothetical protein